MSVAAIKRDDIVRYHEQNYVSGNLIVAAAGDFQTAEMEKLLTARFGALPKKSAPVVSVPKPTPVTGTKMLLVDKPDATQTFFRFGNVGIARTDPDRAAVDIVNTLFGGRFTSKINTALRIDSGLTYGANSGFQRNRQPGAFFINSYTQNSKTEKAMDMAVDVLNDLHKTGFTEEQLKSAKEYIKGQFGPRVETADQLANWISDFEIYGLDAKEVDDYAARIDAVTVADARRVIEKDFPQKNMVWTVIGKSSEIAPLMKKYAATIETRSISDPGLGKK
jgi:zinc protease